jgi:hypothetical protein
MKKLFRTTFVFLLLLTLFGISLEAQQTSLAPDQLIQIAGDYLRAREASMGQSSGKEAVEKVVAFCTDDVVYEHPEFHIKVEGKENMRSGMMSHVGETRNPKITILNKIAGHNMVVIESTEAFEVEKDGKWEPYSRKRVTLFEFDQNKIARIVDYQ